MPETFTSSQLGEVEICEENVLTFPDGVLGFEDCTRYLLVEDPEQEPFVWMQSLDEADLCFVTCDPLLFFPDYKVRASHGDMESIQLEKVEQARIQVILVVPQNPMDITANLQGPIIVNQDKRLCKQLVLLDEEYTTKHRLFESSPTGKAGPEGDE
jgi:flagellar assembly factor FliW